MITCSRCGDRVARRTVNQVHCLPCAAAVAEIIAGDTRRRQPRFAAKDLTTQVIGR